MSRENVEVVQQLVAASQRGDWPGSGLQAVLPAVELDVRRETAGALRSCGEGGGTLPSRWPAASVGANPKWARRVSNLRPLACEASALPLSYAPWTADSNWLALWGV